MKLKVYLFFLFVLTGYNTFAQEHTPSQNFNQGWKFFLGNDSTAIAPGFNDAKWRTLNLPHDWSIEGTFSENSPGTTNEGALPTGIGWYRKTFTVPAASAQKKVFIDFDGVYRDSKVWINGHYLGERPNGYISFRYDLTPYLHFGGKPNVIAVKVDNSQQPNSRWYSGSGIYRNVWLVVTGTTHFEHWGTFITTPKVDTLSATVNINSTVKYTPKIDERYFALETIVYDQSGKQIKKISDFLDFKKGENRKSAEKTIKINAPKLWSVSRPYLYKLVSKLYLITENLNYRPLVDTYTTNFGIRYFNFDAQKGFSLNGKPLKIYGVCQHSDVGALGAVVNTRAIERQFEILKAMGVNAIRTSHNPPAPEFLDLCDKMGFLVMDEAFDQWAKKKNKYDYYMYWKEWHKVDLEDQVKRDRNHPSVFMWSIGNEIREQFDSTGITIGKELVAIVKSLDTTRPVTCALSENKPEKNFIYQSHALDVVGLNYHQEAYADFPKNYPGQKFISTETMSALETRGHYDPVQDTTVKWPHNGKQKFVPDGNADMTVSAYDNVAAYWGTTHEETWKIIKKYPFISGMFVWTGFDYIGEPVPYPWPARSSYYGIIDLAGFPKDVYYMYQSEWTTKPVLHLLPHWNWQPGKIVDVWAYYNNADEVELYLNGKSLGIKKKQGDDLHIAWKVKYETGTLKAVSRLNGKTVLTTEVKTAGKPAKIELTADRGNIKANGIDLSYITVRILDAQGNLVPDADNLVKFTVTGPGLIAGVDNGQQTSLEPFKAGQHKTFNGLGLAIIQSKNVKGAITVKANADGLQLATVKLFSK